mmetsp:Transcript_19067/g.31614  ORF Transcript_19067/g.31614 Transcript_19067/m.31614 type:complete len:203 (-) Transcript_19067:97-705(-)
MPAMSRLCNCLYLHIFLSSRAALAFQPATHAAMLLQSVSFTTTTCTTRSRPTAGIASVRRAAANGGDEGMLSDSKLIGLAKDFIRNKNAAGSGESSLVDVFDMCSASVDLYGLTGSDVRPGFTTFFEKHQSLNHELMEEPSVVGPGVVQYPFVKRWNDENGEHKVWKSIDPEKPRNKVERLGFDDKGRLAKVSVVESEAPLE